MNQIERVRVNAKRLTDKQLLDRSHRFFCDSKHPIDLVVAKGLSLNAQNSIRNAGGELTLKGVKAWIKRMDEQPVPSGRLIKADIDHLPDANLIKKLLMIKNCGLVTAQELVAFCRANGLI